MTKTLTDTVIENKEILKRYKGLLRACKPFVDKEGRNNFEIHFYNLQSKKELNYTILNTEGEIQWANDNNTIFYIINDMLSSNNGEIRKILKFFISSIYRFINNSLSIL